MITNTIFQLSQGKRLQWEDAQQCYVLLYPEGMVKLNTAASEILQCCDGLKTVNDIIQYLQEKFNEPNLQADIMTFLEDAYAKRWIDKRE